MSGLWILIVIGIIVFSLVNSLKGQNKSGTREAGKREPQFRPPVFGSDYEPPSSLSWIAAADELKCTYIRSASPKDYPSLEGVTADGKIKYSVTCADDLEGMPAVTYCFRIPDCADFDFLFTGIEDKTQAKGMISLAPSSLYRDAGNDELRIQTSDTTKLKRYLTRERFDAVREIIGCYDTAEITRNLIILQVEQTSDPEVEHISYISETASVLFEKTPPSSASTPASTPVYEKYTAPEVVKSADAPTPFNVKTPAPKVAFKPKPLFEVTQGKAEKLEVSVSAPEPEPVSAPEPAPIAESDSNAVEAETLSRELFSVSFPGQAEQDAFKRVENSVVTWAGTLKSAYSFMSDFTFGISGKGVKATFLIAEISGSYGMKTKIHAVCALPAESLETLKNAAGKEFRFTGTLMKFEGFAKEIYLKDASLL